MRTVFLCSDELQLYAVADGNGRTPWGERASHMAVEILEREMSARLANGSRAEMESDAMAQALREATAVASKAIFESAQAEPSYAGMGTTLTGLCFHGGSVTCVMWGTRARISSATGGRASSRGSLVGSGTGARGPGLC